MPDNVDIVRWLQVPPDVDLNDFFMGDASEEELLAVRDSISPLYTRDFVCVFHALSDEPRPGPEGLREAWLDWLAPWETYRAEIQDVRAISENEVLVVSRDFARRPGMTDEVEMRGVAIYTLRDGKFARIEFFPDTEVDSVLGRYEDDRAK